MELTVLGSGSSGNCYLLHNKNECLVIEAGISFKEVKKALDFNISKIVGVLVSHEHGDHAKHVKEYLKAGIGVYTSLGTYSSLGVDPLHMFRPLTTDNYIQLGGFVIKPFDVEHDATEPYGFFIYHKDMGYMVFATDTYFVKYKFPDVNQILVECNYKQSILDENYSLGIINNSLRGRTMASHFELENVKEFLRVNDTHHLKKVVLLHLSDRNSDARLFQEECQNVTNKPTYIAEPGLILNLDLVPF